MFKPICIWERERLFPPPPPPNPYRDWSCLNSWIFQLMNQRNICKLIVNNPDVCLNMQGGRSWRNEGKEKIEFLAFKEWVFCPHRGGDSAEHNMLHKYACLFIDKWNGTEIWMINSVSHNSFNFSIWYSFYVLWYMGQNFGVSNKQLHKYLKIQNSFLESNIECRRRHHCANVCEGVGWHSLWVIRQVQHLNLHNVKAMLAPLGSIQGETHFSNKSQCFYPYSANIINFLLF